MHNSDNCSTTSSTTSVIKPTKAASSSKPSISQHLADISKLNLQLALGAFQDLFADDSLEASLSYTYQRIVRHTAYRGTASLNTLGRLWMRVGNICSQGSPSLIQRLQHFQLLPKLQSMYEVTDDIAKRSIFGIGTTLTDLREIKIACKCCMGAPEYCIPNNERTSGSLRFSPEEFLALTEKGIIPKNKKRRTFSGSPVVSLEELNEMISREKRLAMGEKLEIEEIEESKEIEEQDDDTGRRSCNSENELIRDPHGNGWILKPIVKV